MSRWKKKGYWKIIDGEMWYYRGYRTENRAARQFVDILYWSGGLLATKLFNENLNVYQIFVKPKEIEGVGFYADSNNMTVSFDGNVGIGTGAGNFFIDIDNPVGLGIDTPSQELHIHNETTTQ